MTSHIFVALQNKSNFEYTCLRKPVLIVMWSMMKNQQKIISPIRFSTPVSKCLSSFSPLQTPHSRKGGHLVFEKTFYVQSHLLVTITYFVLVHQLSKTSQAKVTF